MDPGGGDMDMDMGDGMSMVFAPWSQFQLKVIWDWWDVRTKGQYAATLLAVFGAVVLYRYLVRVELALARRTAAGAAGGVVGGGSGGGGGGIVGNAELGESLMPGAGGPAGRKGLLLSRIPWPRRLAHAGLSGLLYGYALILMLAAMTYNPGVFVALVLGYIAGEVAWGSTLVAGGVAAAQAKGSACCD